MQQLVTFIIIIEWVVQSVVISVQVEGDFDRGPFFNKGFYSGCFRFRKSHRSSIVKIARVGFTCRANIVDPPFESVISI